MRFAEHLVLAAVDVDERGQKHVLGLRERATENAAAVRVLLADLVERALNPDRSLLVVVDGARARHKAVGGRYVERALNSQYTGFSNLSTMLTDLHLGTNKMFPCGAGLGLLDVDGNGDVYLCHRFPGVEEHKYGNVRQGGIEYGRLTEFVNSVQVGNKPVCQTCWIRGICGGGCYHEALQEFGEAALPNLHYCVFLREWTEYGIGVFTELEQKNPGFVEKYIVRSRSDVPKELS